METVSSPSPSTLDEAEIKKLYPQLFAELTAFPTLSDAEFAQRYLRFVVELERDFMQEEQWLDRLEPNAQREHRAEHAELLRLLHHAQSRILAGDCGLGRKIIPLLSQWFIDHISHMDTAWANIIAQAELEQPLTMLNAA